MMRSRLAALFLVLVFLGTTSLDTAAAPEPAESAFSFRVLVDGSEIASFTAVEGLDAEIDVVELRSGDETDTVRKIPGATEYSNIVLRRAYKAGASSADDALWLWWKEGVERRRDARDGRIEIFDRSGSPVGSWCFHEAWIARWTGPVLPTDRSEDPFEVVELAHEGFDRCEPDPVVESKS